MPYVALLHPISYVYTYILICKIQTKVIDNHINYNVCNVRVTLFCSRYVCICDFRFVP